MRFRSTTNFDMLEMRLGQMDEVTDHFVMIEVQRTYKGDSKPLYYTENKERFSKWNHKIHCITPNLGLAGSWEFEVTQRNALLETIRGLNAGLGDTITFSDCDEIPNPTVVRAHTPALGLRNLNQYTFWYNYNRLMNYGARSFSRARIGTIKEMYERGPMHFRGGPQDDMDPNFPSVDNGGWHGTYFGSSIERIRRKVHSFSHDDLVPFIDSRTDKQIAEDIHNGICIYHLEGIGQAEVVDSNDPIRVPPYFRQNKERFSLFTDAFFCEKYKQLLEEPETGVGATEKPSKLRRFSRGR